MDFPAGMFDRLQHGHLSLGCFAITAAPAAAELLADQCRLDWIGIDLQHGQLGGDTLAHVVRAIQAANRTIAPVARVRSHEAHAILQPLDAGCVGLIVPCVESREQAEHIVHAAYYPPKGRRSVGGLRVSLYGPQYARLINQKLVLLLQIESGPGLEEVEQIAGVPGVSGCLLGPADLSMDLGWSRESLWSHEPFLAAAKRIVVACEAADKVPAVLLGGEEQAKVARDLGFRFIGFGSDVGSLRTASEEMNEAAARLRESPPR